MTEACKKCNASGFVEVKGGVKPCQCRRDRKIENHLQDLPKHFRGKTFRDYRESGCCRPPSNSVLKVTEVLKADIKSGCFLSGPIGSGKTHLLAAKFRMLAERGEFRTLFWREVDLIHGLQKKMYAEEGAGFEQLENMGYCHLFIDDMGKTPITDDRAYQVFRLVDLFFNNEFQMTISSNFKMSELESRLGGEYGPAIVKRLKTVCPNWILMK